MAADSITSRPPDARFLLAHPAHFIALGFGAGLAPKAPGTVGTLVAIPLYWALALVLPPLAIALVAIPLFFLGIWACDVTGRDLGVPDHGAMVWDEIVAFLPLAALASMFDPVDGASRPRSLALQLVAFGLFRLFDIWKPFPIRELEKRVKGGLGVMIDDVVAAAYAYLAFVVFIIVVHKLFGYEG
jgi:phosphatidylglycerophosphatase A